MCYITITACANTHAHPFRDMLTSAYHALKYLDHHGVVVIGPQAIVQSQDHQHESITEETYTSIHLFHPRNNK